MTVVIAAPIGSIVGIIIIMVIIVVYYKKRYVNVTEKHDTSDHYMLKLCPRKNENQRLKEYSVILTTSFNDLNQKILRKKVYFQNFS